MSKLILQTGPGVFEVLASVCRSHLEALKQFVENSADAIQQLCVEEGHITVRLKYENSSETQVKYLESVVIEDNGIGMSREKMQFVLEHIGDSEKVQLALRGEKGIGILAFANIAEDIHIASTSHDGMDSSCIVLKRGWLKSGQAEIIDRCSRHTHSQRGTVVYLEKILPEASSNLNKEKLKEYLGREFASDLRQGIYAMSISDNDEAETIPPQRYRGVKAMAIMISLGKIGSASIELHVLPWDMADANISLYGRGGVRICFLTDMEEFRRLPWNDKRIEGHIRCDALKRTADKAAVVQDQLYQLFVAELRKLEPQIFELIDTISASTKERRFEVIMHKTSRLIDKFLRYRDRGMLTELTYRAIVSKPEKAGVLKAVENPPRETVEKPRKPAEPRLLDDRVPGIGLYAPPQDRSQSRSWFDLKSGCICINREHPEFMLAQREDARCVRYLFTIWAKESLLKEYGADAERLADEMVGMLAEAEPLLW